ncbi:glycosyltransferase family 32 protein [Rhizoctonia solani AG-3 Rhs1AP]|uniref:Glycosyltransferase family 32 protein n=2 Tax=Rhizoctonia solani AG-3 TaxID=1086053 RepID=A0A074S320_9AGAM|nr:glycosyltransferase family 32 protein [Rhizoctonia solani AG-3 Rhs1AP]KEP53659.1 glycosyltransferase family 32 protein [Rhizoctonia solani 123E]
MAFHNGKPRLSPLPSYTNAIEEKQHLTHRGSGWTTTFYVPLPFRQGQRMKIVLPIPQRISAVTSSQMSRRKAFLCIGLLFLTWIGFGFTAWFKRPGERWRPPLPGPPSTLVFRRSELQKIWEWEIASGHYPINRPIPSTIGITAPPPNPGLPTVGAPITGRPKSLSMRPAPVGTGPGRRYATIKSQPPNTHIPLRPPPGGMADLDVIMDHCDFATHKYVRDCLEFMRVGTGIDADKRFRRENLDKYNFIYTEEKDENAASPPKNSPKVAPAGGHIVYPAGPDDGLFFNSRNYIEPALQLPSPRTPQTSKDACDPDHPRVYHMYWTGEFSDKPYMALMSYLFTQNLGLGEEPGKAPPPGVCRPEFWMWISPGPAAAALGQSALKDMFEGLKKSPWASPFLHPRFKDVIKFKLWNTTEQLDAIPEIKDEWRALEETLFNSGGVVYKVKKPAANNTTTAAKKDGNDVINRVGSDSAQNYDRMSTILSDMARFVLCHRFGGTYLDADTILLRDWEDLWGYKGAFAYRWSRLEEYNTAVLRLNRGSALGTFLFRTALHNGLDFHPMTIWRYIKDAHLHGLLLRLPDALFDSAWLNTEDYQRDRPAFPFFTDFGQFFESPKQDSAAPNMLGFDGFFRGAYSYHFHNFWWLPFDKARNFPDLGSRFVAGEKLAKDNLLRKAREAQVQKEGEHNAVRMAHLERWSQDEDQPDLPWATVLKRTFEAFIRGERANMYGEYIKW